MEESSDQLKRMLTLLVTHAIAKSREAGELREKLVQLQNPTNVATSSSSASTSASSSTSVDTPHNSMFQRSTQPSMVVKPSSPEHLSYPVSVSSNASPVIPLSPTSLPLSSLDSMVTVAPPTGDVVLHTTIVNSSSPVPMASSSSSALRIRLINSIPYCILPPDDGMTHRLLQQFEDIVNWPSPSVAGKQFTLKDCPFLTDNEMILCPLQYYINFIHQQQIGSDNNAAIPVVPITIESMSSPGPVPSLAKDTIPTVENNAAVSTGSTMIKTETNTVTNGPIVSPSKQDVEIQTEYEIGTIAKQTLPPSPTVLSSTSLPVHASSISSPTKVKKRTKPVANTLVQPPFVTSVKSKNSVSSNNRALSPSIGKTVPLSNQGKRAESTNDVNGNSDHYISTSPEHHKFVQEKLKKLSSPQNGKGYPTNEGRKSSSTVSYDVTETVHTLPSSSYTGSAYSDNNSTLMNSTDTFFMSPNDPASILIQTIDDLLLKESINGNKGSKSSTTNNLDSGTPSLPNTMESITAVPNPTDVSHTVMSTAPVDEGEDTGKSKKDKKEKKEKKEKKDKKEKKESSSSSGIDTLDYLADPSGDNTVPPNAPTTITDVTETKVKRDGPETENAVPDTGKVSKKKKEKKDKEERSTDQTIPLASSNGDTAVNTDPVPSSVVAIVPVPIPASLPSPTSHALTSPSRSHHHHPSSSSQGLTPTRLSHSEFKSHKEPDNLPVKENHYLATGGGIIHRYIVPSPNSRSLSPPWVPGGINRSRSPQYSPTQGTRTKNTPSISPTKASNNTRFGTNITGTNKPTVHTNNATGNTSTSTVYRPRNIGASFLAIRPQNPLETKLRKVLIHSNNTNSSGKMVPLTNRTAGDTNIGISNVNTKNTLPDNQLALLRNLLLSNTLQSTGTPTTTSTFSPSASSTITGLLSPNSSQSFRSTGSTDDALTSALLKVIRSPGGAPVDQRTGLEDIDSFVQKLGITLPFDITVGIKNTDSNDNNSQSTICLSDNSNAEVVDPILAIAEARQKAKLRANNASL